MAEEDDDDGFGDFAFASFNPSSSHTQTHRGSGLRSPIAITNVKDDGDDEWGDFVKTPLGSYASSNNTPSKSPSVDPFNFFSQSLNPSSQLEKSESGNSARAEFEPTWMQKKENQNQNVWVKLKGAIPLSIFGEIEEEEKEDEVRRSGLSDPHHTDGKDLNANKKVDNVSDRLKSDGNLGVSFSYDAITSLYNPQLNTNYNSVGMHMNGLNLDTNGVNISKKGSPLELSGLNLDAVSMHKRSDSDSVMNLSSQILRRKVDDGVNASSKGMSSNLNALDLDFSGWNADFNDKSNLNLDVMKNVNDHSLQSRDEISNSQNNSNGIGFGTKDNNYSLFDGPDLKSDLMGSKLFSSSLNTNGVEIASNYDGRKEELGSREKDDGDDDEDGDWEFKDARLPSEVNVGNEEVSYEVEKISGNNGMSNVGNGTSGPTNLFTATNGSSDLFSMLNGFPDSYLSGDQTGSKAILDPHLAAESVESDEVFGEFAGAHGEAGEMLEADSKRHEISDVNASSLGFKSSNGSVDLSVLSGSFDLFQPSNGKSSDSNEVIIGYDATTNDEAAFSSHKFDMSLRSERKEGEHLRDPDIIIQTAEFDDDFGDFEEASTENALKIQIGDLSQTELENSKHDGVLQETEINLDHHKGGALPLSIFGDEEEEVDGPLNADNTFMLQPASSKGNGYSPNSSILINDLISNLYSQAEQISSSTSQPTQVVNGSDSSDSVSASNLVNFADGDDNSSWEFKDSFSHGVDEIGRPFYENENAHQSHYGKLKLQSYVDFYSKLKDELYFIAKAHLASLKETHNASDSCEDENWATLVAEIQEACKELGPENEITKEDSLGNHSGRDVNLNDFVEVLQDPKFHILQAEYNLEKKFLLVERDVRSLVELMQHAKTMLKIFMMGSLEDQSSYVSLWSKMIYACAQEMQHGALIWRQSLEKNIHSQILAEPQGQTFVLALGEIYRVVVLLGSTVKLYKPWILSSHMDLYRLHSLLEKCHLSWSSSGLKEALLSVLEAAPSEGSPNLPSILDSIKYIYDLDELALQNHVFVQEEPLCRLSLLAPSVAPGMAMVNWDDEHCFLRLANLWANLVSSEHPKLPPIPVNG